MLASAFVTYFFISHSKFKLPRLYFNSSTACSLLLCTTLPRSWRSRRSQGTAAWQGGPRAPHTVPGCSVAQELLTPWSTHKAWEEDATRCHSLLGSCFSEGCKLWSFLPIIWLWLLRNHPFSPWVSPILLWRPGRSTGKGQPGWVQLWGATRYLSPGHKPHRVVLRVGRRWRWMPAHPVHEWKLQDHFQCDAAWILYTGYAKTPSYLNRLGKSLHSDLFTFAESPKL